MSNSERKIARKTIPFLVSAAIFTGGIIAATEINNESSETSPNEISTRTPFPEPNPSPAKKSPEETPGPRPSIYSESLDQFSNITVYFESPRPISPPSL